MKKFITIISVFLFLVMFFNSKAFSQLNGTYTVGIGGNYTFMFSAINALETQGVNGPVIFNIMPGVFGEAVLIHSIQGASSSNTITFQSESGNPNTVILGVASGTAPVVTLQGTDFITFKNISFINDQLHGIVFQISGSCDAVSLINNKIISDSLFSLGIYSNDANTRNLRIENNFISAHTGIKLSGSQRSAGTKIVNNQIKRIEGIILSNQDSLLIEKNHINVTSYSRWNGFNTDYYNAHGITLTDCNQYLSIIKNEIISLGAPRYEGSTGIAILNCVLQNSLIANNFVISVDRESLLILNSSNLNVYFNTFKMEAAYSPDGGKCMSLINNTLCNVKNNIFEGYGNLMASNVSLISDHNCFYGTEKYFQLPFVFKYNGTDYYFIDDYTAASNNDFNSVERIVHFTNVLHLTGSSIGDTNLIGTPIAGITDDIDNDPRNAQFPYMGADEADIVLPVELSSFSYSANGNNVTLKWKTSSEINNSEFKVERSKVIETISGNWQTIGSVTGKGTTNSPNDYSFTDNNLSSGKYKYRLRQIDYNGSIQYFHLSSEVAISIPVTFTLLQNYPNPFNPVTVISYQLPAGSFISLKIYDLAGKEVSTLVNEKQDAGYYTVNFNAASLSSGVYFYKLQSDGFAETKRMTLIK